jgi:FAD/FMN-containing dehydrogenase
MDLDSLRACFSGRVLTKSADCEPFVLDWRKVWRGRAAAVAMPDTPEDVAAVVRWCAANRVSIVPQGGNTGLSGGATPDASGDQLVLSLTRLNRVRSVDPVNNTMTVEAGCTLHDVRAAAAEHGRLFPLNMASAGSATIGGNLATNAGGIEALRYGTARRLCLGIEAVTAAGELWSSLRSLRKDNTGYDLRDLLIGSEGTLGIITVAVLSVVPQPTQRVVVWIAIGSMQHACMVFQEAHGHFPAELTSCELVSAGAAGLVERLMPSARIPFAGIPPCAVLLEFSAGAHRHSLESDVEQLLSSLSNRSVIIDAVVADGPSQAARFWASREHISEAQARAGAAIKHDIAVPIAAIPSFVAEADRVVEREFPELELIVFGHLGDGNLHYNLSPRQGVSNDRVNELVQPVNRVVHDVVRRFDGSISAEHGLGVLRRDEADRYRSPVERQLMMAVKQALDPLGLLNPGKVLPGW